METRAGNVTTKKSKDYKQRDGEIEHEDRQGPIKAFRHSPRSIGGEGVVLLQESEWESKKK
jgi:hypothetical protein